MSMFSTGAKALMFTKGSEGGNGLGGIFAGFVAKEYAATVSPASADAAITGTLLRTYTVNHDGITGGHFLAPSNFMIVCDTSENMAGAAVANGTIKYMRLVLPDDDGTLSTTAPRIQFSIGLAGSGADIIRNSVSAVSGAIETLDPISVAFPFSTLSGQLSTGLKNKLLGDSGESTGGAFPDLLDGFVVDWFPSIPPTSPDNAPGQDLLLSESLEGGETGMAWSATPTDGVIVRDMGQLGVGIGLKSGTAGWIRVRQLGDDNSSSATACRFDLTIGPTGADVFVSDADTAIVLGHSYVAGRLSMAWA